MTRVVVLGAGIVGLWTAEVLASRGHRVTVWSAQTPEATTSASAACVITPLLPWEPDDERFCLAWGRYRRTIEKFRAIDAPRSERERFLEPMPSYECGFEDEHGRFLEKGFGVTKFKHLPFTKVEIIDLDPPVWIENHVDEPHECSFCARFVADFCNTERFLAWMLVDLPTRGVRFEFGRALRREDIEGADAEVVFNCMGLDSGRVFPDPQLTAVRGQSMFIDAESPTGPLFGIASGHHAIFKHQRGFYVGSYFIDFDPRTRRVPSETEYRLSLRFASGPYVELCRRLGFEEPTVDFDRVRRVNNGLRPFREDGPRIEAEALSCGPDGHVKVVHNYGHGAHGWTVGYATAEDAVNLAETKGWLGVGDPLNSWEDG